MYQQVTLVGHLGRDPEMRYTPTGTPVTNFTMAVSRSWVSQDGERQEKTIWFRVTAWRKLAETASEYLVKGSKVLVVGEMEEANAYIDKEGQARASLEVTANTIRFLSSRSQGNGDEETELSEAPAEKPSAPSKPSAPQKPSTASGGKKGAAISDADIPF